MLDFLLNDLYYLWNKATMKQITKEIIALNWIEGAMKCVIHGKCFKILIEEMAYTPEKIMNLFEMLFDQTFKP